MGIRLHRVGILLSLVLLLSVAASANYHFVHYRSVVGPYTPVLEKFDQNSLVDSTVRYYISPTAPDLLAPGDSMASLLSQIRLAAEAWNAVPTSSLRIAFGGVAEDTISQRAPGIDILFDEEIPPGIIAMGGPTARLDMVVREDDSAFVPIARSVVVLNKDLSRQPSSSDAFFMTLVHEMGHALGLQHTFTSSMMSTSITRSTTKASPLALDDQAGLSILYPTPGFAETTGTITGRVVLGDAGVHLASVVAISTHGAAISTLSDPDGVFRMQGVPKGEYYVYVHPLPPPVYGEVSRANIYMPRGPDGEPVTADAYFDTQFYPGVKSFQSAVPVAVTAGSESGGVDFFVNARGVPPIHSVRTFSYPGTRWVESGHMSLSTPWRFLLVDWFGLDASSGIPQGLDASVIGASVYVPEERGLEVFAPDPRFVQINLEFNPFSGTGSRHLLLSSNGEIHVRPAGLHLTQSEPPTVQSVSTTVDAEGRETVAVVGQRIRSTSRILFDGAPAEILGETAPGEFVVRPPAAPADHQASVVVLNPDGQSSWFLDAVEPPTYRYGPRPEATFEVHPSSLAAGTEAMVQIRGENTRFAPGKTALGFGSSDVVVRDYLVLDPTVILANVAVAADASETPISVSVATGVEFLTRPQAFQVLPAGQPRPSIHTPAYDLETGKPTAFAGKTATVRVSQLPPDITPAEIELTLNEQPAPVSSIEGDRISFAVPGTVGPGPVIARLTVAGINAEPILLLVALAPPKILSIHTETWDPVSAEKPLHPGGLVQMRITGVGPAEQSVEADRVWVIVAGIKHLVSDPEPELGQPEIRIIRFNLGTTVAPGEAVPVTVAFDGRESDPVAVVVAGE